MWDELTVIFTIPELFIVIKLHLPCLWFCGIHIFTSFNNNWEWICRKENCFINWSFPMNNTKYLTELTSKSNNTTRVLRINCEGNWRLNFQEDGFNRARNILTRSKNQLSIFLTWKISNFSYNFAKQLSLKTIIWFFASFRSRYFFDKI